MFKSFPLLSAVVLLGFATTSASARPPQEAAPTPAPSTTPTKNPGKVTPQSQEKAKKLYAIDCALCHGDNGDGKTDVAKSMDMTLADWTDPKSLANKSDQELFDVIRKGKDKMPAEADGRAKDDEVWNLISYIRKMSKGQPAAAQPAPAQPAATPAPSN